MISLRKSLTELEDLDTRFRTSLNCYLGAIASIEEHLPEAGKEAVAEHRQKLKQIRKDVADDPAMSKLEDSRLELDEQCRWYAERANSHFRLKEKEIQRILEVLAEAAGTLTERSELYTAQFRRVAGDLESVSRLDNLSLIRRKLSDGVARLKNSVEAMRRDDQASVARLQEELASVRRRLEEAEREAATDPLTGLANRREAERLIARKIQDGHTFCIMLFDLDGFKSINDRHGHTVGDQVLKSFAKRLVEQYRSDDVVCRWGGDEFLVVLSNGLPDAAGRAGDVADRTRGLYPVAIAVGTASLYVSASVGVAQHRPGESCQDLFARADAFLYQHKGTGVAEKVRA